MIAVAQGPSKLLSIVEGFSVHKEGQADLVLVLGISHVFLTLLFFGGLALAAFHPQKKAVHDLVVGSVVTYRVGTKP